ncbi:MAG: hypothetical protein N2323_05325 [candidate division WOR-3 bacterium]|nr:hypothetical protein [candidate division WOR-3 bacterium]
MGSNPTLSVLLIIIIFFFPNISEAEKKIPKNWLYLRLGDVSFGPSLSYLKILPLNIGFSSPINFEISTTLIECGSLMDILKEKYINWMSLFPLSYYWAPIISWSKKRSSVIYIFFEFCKWAFDEDITKDYPVLKDLYYRTGFGINYRFLLISLYFQAGFSGYIDYESYQRDRFKNLFFNIGISFFSYCFAFNSKEISSPLIKLKISFIDEDGNKLLSPNEEGKIEVYISNKGGLAENVTIENSILEKEFKDKISYQPFIGIGKIEKGEIRKIEIPIKIIDRLPKSSFTFQILCNYKGGSKREEIKINNSYLSFAKYK